MQELAAEYCWGYLWGCEGLPRKTRSMLNLATIRALNRARIEDARALVEFASAYGRE